MDHVSTDGVNNGDTNGLGHDSALDHGGVAALNPTPAAAADVSTVLTATSEIGGAAVDNGNDTPVPLIAPQPPPQPQPPAPANDNAAISPGSSSSDGGAAIEQPPVSVLTLPLPPPQVEQAPVSTPVEPVDPAGDAVQPPASPVGQGVAEVPATRQVVVEFAYPQFPGSTRPEGDSFEADGSRSVVELPDAWSFLPILGSVRTKLGLVTQALFAQRDFSRLDLLETLYASLQSIEHPISDSTLYTGISLREVVNKFKQKTLQLFKLLLLEKRVLFFGQKVERLSSYQYGLVSLVPELLRSLQDVGSPEAAGLKPSLSPLPEEEPTPSPPSPSPTTMTTADAGGAGKSRARHFGLPLRIFGKGSFFQPYIPLQQMDVLMSPETKSFLVGTSNAIFTHHRACAIDVVANVDTGVLDIKDSSLASVLSLTSADKRFIDDDPSLNQQIEFEGSDEDIRARFEHYLYTLLVSTRTAERPPSPSPPADSGLPQAKPKDVLYDFNTSWVRAWQQTGNYKIWAAAAPNDILELGVAAGHPKEAPSAVAAMAARLQELGRNMAPLQQNLGRALETAGARTSAVAGESSRSIQ
ncbi:late secretory pathway protein avl9, partial [Cladochytrium tenue]